ncbi:MAG TPA: hypothetical protein VN033_14185 [Vulgatibacter sp.]|nr:hypothetical protein [Vulgatibacter sp.]
MSPTLERMRALRRLAVSLGVSAAAIALVGIGRAPPRAVAAAAAEDPHLGIFPTYPGAPAVAVGDGLRVDGRLVSTTTFHTRASPAEVIAFHRRHFEALPVELVENPLPDGLALFVLDVHEGRRGLVTARSKGGITEVIRGWSPLEEEDADAADQLPPTPDDLAAISRVDDGEALTWTAHADRDPAALAGELIGRFVEAGWKQESADRERASVGAARTVRLSREGRSATLSVGSMPEGGALVAIRILPGDG